MNTIYDPRYIHLIQALVTARKNRGITQLALAQKLKQPQSYVAKVEGLERRLDIIELLDWLECLNYEPQIFFEDIGWFSRKKKTIIPLPIKGQVKANEKGVLQELAWENQVIEVLLEGITVEQYLGVEEYITNLFSSLNLSPSRLKNREAIVQALEYAINELPNLNPSDIYQHLIYRIYLREYQKENLSYLGVYIAKHL